MDHVMSNCPFSLQKETNKDLEWLKKVKPHFGNVEIKSINQATAINDNGFYYVGNIHGHSTDFKVMILRSLDQ